MSYYKGISEIPLYKQSIGSDGVVSQVLDWEPNKIANLLDLQYDESKYLFYKNDNTMGIYVKPDYQQNTLVIRFYFNDAITNMQLTDATITAATTNRQYSLGYAKSPTRKGLMLGFYPSSGDGAFGPVLNTFIVTFKNINTQEEKIGYIFSSEFGTARIDNNEAHHYGIILEGEKSFTKYASYRHAANVPNSSSKVLSLAPITYKDFYAEETYNFNYSNNYPKLFDSTLRSILLISTSNKKFLTSTVPRLLGLYGGWGLSSTYEFNRYAVMEVDV